MPGKIATIADIAKIAGVSSATVSRVINNSGYVGAKTRSLVENAVKTTGFVPNAAAKAMVTRQTNLVGLIIPTFENPVYQEILKGANDAAVERGFSVVLGLEGEDDKSVSAAILRLAALQVDGIIVAKPEFHSIETAEHLKPFIARRLPIVQLGNRVAENDIDGITIDNFDCGYAAGMHFSRLGHESLTMIGEPVNGFVRERQEGFRKAYVDQGLPVSGLVVEAADFSRSGGNAAALRALAARPGTTALLAMNDIMAIGAIDAAERAGRRVPEDLAIAGFDGIQLGALVRPRLTTIIFPTYEMGRALVDLLLSRIEGEWAGEARQMIFKGRLMVRESTMRMA
jgi:DNA-binding LacI/PurR family transcriptional regulator